MSKLFKNKTTLFLSMLVMTALTPATFLAQNFNSDLYLQTSEVNNSMVHYDADKGSIMRFYSTNSTADTYGVQYDPTNYNTPERRTRLLTLINDYKKQLEALNFY